MCYGGYDAKFMMRDIEERVKGVAFTADKSETPQQAPFGGLIVWLSVVLRRIYRKDPVHG